MNCSTRATAMRTSRFSRSADSTSPFSTGSPNCSHHLVFATSAAFGYSMRHASGESTVGRT